MRYFQKEIASNRLYLPNGRPIEFEIVGSDTGLLAVEDNAQELLSQLDNAIKRRVGGVVEITRDRYEDLKKNPPVNRSRLNSFNALSLLRDVTNPPAAAAPAVRDSGRASQAEPAKEPHQSQPLEVPEKIPNVSSLRRARTKRAAKAEGSVASAA